MRRKTLLFGLRGWVFGVIRLLLLLIALANSIAAYAAENASDKYANAKQPLNSSLNLNGINDINLRPQLTLWGYVDNEGIPALGEEQALIPLQSFAIQSNNVLYLAEESARSANDINWLVGIGGGYRQLAPNNRILGVYAMADYNNTESNHGFWVINPGFESLGETWDFRGNIYLALGAKYWPAKTGWESDRGVYNYIHQTGHEYRDHKYLECENTGNGGDFEVGRVFPKLHHLKLYGGSYYFMLPSKDYIAGISGRVEYPLRDNLSLEMRAMHDNYTHNALLLGIKLNFGGISKGRNTEKMQFDISRRLLEPIEHAREYTVGIPLQKSYRDLGKEELKLDHVWYFRSNEGKASNTNDSNDAAKTEDGTYEHPYLHGIDQEKLEHIEKDKAGENYANLFLAPGTYSLDSFKNSRLTLPQGYNIFGRNNNNYEAKASGDTRPLLLGGIDLPYGHNIIDSIKLYNNDNKQNVGIQIGAAIDDKQIFSDKKDNKQEQCNNKNKKKNYDITLNDIVVGAENVNEGYQTGISINNAANVNLSNSTVYGYRLNTDTEVDGIKLLYSELNLLADNTISGKNINKTEGDIIMGYGIYAAHSTVNLNGDNNFIAGYGEGMEKAANNGENKKFNMGIGGGIGIGAYSSQININGNNNSILAIGRQSNSGWGWGIDADTSKVNINGNKNLIEGQGYSAEDGEASGINSNDSKINISGNENSILSDETSDRNAISYGINSYSDVITISGNNNVIGGDAVGLRIGLGYGIAAAASIINISGSGNTIYADGTNRMYGIYAKWEEGIINIEGATNFVIGKNKNSATANNIYGIYLDDDFNMANLTVKNASFDLLNNNNSDAYGIYDATEQSFSDEQYKALKNDNKYNVDDKHQVASRIKRD